LNRIVIWQFGSNLLAQLFQSEKNGWKSSGVGELHILSTAVRVKTADRVGYRLRYWCYSVKSKYLSGSRPLIGLDTD